MNIDGHVQPEPRSWDADYWLHAHAIGLSNVSETIGSCVLVPIRNIGRLACSVASHASKDAARGLTDIARDDALSKRARSQLMHRPWSGSRHWPSR